MKNTIDRLDQLANSLEKRGLNKYASSIDVISNSLEEVQKKEQSETDDGDGDK